MQRSVLASESPEAYSPKAHVLQPCAHLFSPGIANPATFQTPYSLPPLEVYAVGRKDLARWLWTWQLARLYLSAGLGKVLVGDPAWRSLEAVRSALSAAGRARLQESPFRRASGQEIP